MKKRPILIEGNIWLPLPELKAEVIAAYIKEAKDKGMHKLNFTFGDVTAVKFTIIL